MIEKHRLIVHDYWNKTERGIEMIKSNHVSDFDLLFLIPNNKKKILGLPLTRISKKYKKKKYKNDKINLIISFKLFDLIEETVNDILGNNFVEDEFFQTFVEFQNIEQPSIINEMNMINRFNWLI